MRPSPAGKRRLKIAYAGSVSVVSDIPRRRDPVGLAGDGGPPGEYDPEAGSIIARVREMASEDDVLRIVTEEFQRWFGEWTHVDPDAPRLAVEDVWNCL